MGRVRRLEHARHVGTRDTMLVYDQDDPRQAEELERRVATDALIDRVLIQTFAPDTMVEARNRGFRPARHLSG